jgi:hypothetical protein
VLATGRLELRWYLREQAISHVVHRYGNVMDVSAAAPLSPSPPTPARS